MDEIMMALADEHRRELLAALMEENGQPIQTPEDVQLGREPLDDLQIELYHNHLPRLEEAGFIEWEKDRDVVTKGPKFGQLEPVLELFAENAEDFPVTWP